jgi:putative ABC transport system permease protein
LQPFSKNTHIITGIEHVSLTTDSPLYIGSIVTNGRWEGKDPDTDPPITLFGVDSDFLDTFDVNLVQGQFFGPATPSQSSDVVINEKLAGFVGKEEVIGTQITSLEKNFNVIGLTTVSIQSLRAALANPVDSLRHE